MAGGSANDGPPTQSSFVTGVFAFNLIIGVGALALPNSMNHVGYIFGSCLLLVVGVLGYATTTFVLEAIANTSALKSIGIDALIDEPLTEQSLLNSTTVPHPTERKEGGSYSDARSEVKVQRMELSAMSDMLFPAWGRVCFYIVICIYLYGDLAIYGAAVPTTLADFTDYYYIVFLSIFSACMIPFVFFNFAKTKYMQIATLATRNIALLSMIILTIKFIADGKGSSKVSPAKPGGLSIAFGNIVYAFMCHHSIPSIISPMKAKYQAKKVFLITFIFVACVYLLLSITALFAFANVTEDKCKSSPGPACRLQPLFTQNFSSFNQQWLAGFLTLFPVFTLTSNFPLISITLRNNLMTLFQCLNILQHNKQLQYVVCCLLSPVPPLLLVFFVRDVSVLVSLTGSYAGMFIMFVVPTCLVHTSRKRCIERFGQVPDHGMQSPFQHIAWIYLILLFSLGSLVIITVNNVLKLSGNA